MTALALQQSPPRNSSKTHIAVVRRRLEKLLATDIDFIPHPDFAAQAECPKAATDFETPPHSETSPVDLPPHLKRMCETSLLSADEEADLFRKMNFAKFLACRLRAELDAEIPELDQIRRIEWLLERAAASREHIIKANVRLVMSIVKKFVTPQQAFDEMLSEGLVTLMQAVEKFDFERGFRFSTYAYRSIARNAYRVVATAQKEAARFRGDGDEWAFDQAEGTNHSSLDEQVWHNLRELTAAMLDRLDRRENFIIQRRFALGEQHKVRSFQSLADELGVSKERVRQLEQRAVSKLKAMAAEHAMDDLFSAAMA